MSSEFGPPLLDTMSSLMGKICLAHDLDQHDKTSAMRIRMLSKHQRTKRDEEANRVDWKQMEQLLKPLFTTIEDFFEYDVDMINDMLGDAGVKQDLFFSSKHDAVVSFLNMFPDKKVTLGVHLNKVCLSLS